MIKEIKDEDIGIVLQYEGWHSHHLKINKDLRSKEEAEELKQFILSRCSKEAIDKALKYDIMTTEGYSTDKVREEIKIHNKNAEIVEKLRKLLPSIEEDYRILCSLQDEDYTKASNTPKRLKEIKSILGDEK